MNEMEIRQLSSKIGKEWLYSAAVLLNEDVTKRMKKEDLLKRIVDKVEKDPPLAILLMDFTMTGNLGEFIEKKMTSAGKRKKITQKSIDDLKIRLFEKNGISPIKSKEFGRSADTFFHAMVDRGLLEKLLTDRREETEVGMGAAFSSFIYWNLIHFYGVLTPEELAEEFENLTGNRSEFPEIMDFILCHIDHSYPGNIYLEEIDGTLYILGGTEIVEHEVIMELSNEAEYDRVPLMIEDVTSMYMGISLEFIADMSDAIRKYIDLDTEEKVAKIQDIYYLAELASYFRYPFYEEVITKLKDEFGILPAKEPRLRTEIEVLSRRSPKYELNGYSEEEIELLLNMLNTDGFDEDFDPDDFDADDYYDYDLEDDEDNGPSFDNVIDFHSEKKKRSNKRNNKFLN